MKRRQAGFSFIEILVVMSIIVVLVSMVVVLVPMIQEKARRTKSIDNVRTMVNFYIGDGAGVSKPWPPFNGKNFILWLVATNKLDKANRDNLAVLFSPGDSEVTLDATTPKDWEAVTLPAIQSEGHNEFLKLTSYAGRRNATTGHKLSATELEHGALIICDDDTGPLHHSKGLIVGYTSGSAQFKEWSDLGISPPDAKDPKGMLGDNAANEDLKHMSSEN